VQSYPTPVVATLRHAGPLTPVLGVNLRKRWARLRYLVKSDLCRHGQGLFWHHYIRTPGFRFMAWHRFRAAIEGLPGVRFGFQQCVSWHLHSMAIRFGITLPVECAVGPGFYIGHFGGIVIHQEVQIGRDCNLSQGVTVGLASRGKYFGCPTIGDRVYIGPGAKIFGKIVIGDDVAIGANAVVTRDVPAGAVVVGMPAKVISTAGSAGYICNTHYGEAPL
jgi:serine O-acetyltransferase